MYMYRTGGPTNMRHVIRTCREHRLTIVPRAVDWREAQRQECTARQRREQDSVRCGVAQRGACRSRRWPPLPRTRRRPSRASTAM